MSEYQHKPSSRATSCRNDVKKVEHLKVGEGGKTLQIKAGLLLTGSFKLSFFDQDLHHSKHGLLGMHLPTKHKSKDDKMFQCWVDTAFVTEQVPTRKSVQEMKYVLHKMELDKARKDKKHHRFERDFSIELQFEVYDPDHGGSGELD